MIPANECLDLLDAGLVERVPRAPNGKADYKTAKQVAVDATS